MTRTFKLIAIDVDGTLITSDQRVTGRVATVLRRLHSQGIAIALVTGRPSFHTHMIEEPLGFSPHIVGFNGAVGLVANTKQVLFAHEMSSVQVSQIDEAARTLGLTCCLYELPHENIQITSDVKDKPLIDRFFEESTTPFVNLQSQTLPTRNVPKMFLLTNNPSTDILKVRALCPSVNVYEERYFLDCVPKGIHKGIGLTTLCESLNISLEETVAFGDGTNDLEFLQTAGLGIAMKNGVDALKQVANRVSQFTNDEDGVAIELEAMLEQGLF
ncbi:hypothetical protein HDU79_008001 [Rhizoclosmatium sp. JEL0117]|nr:hypothetical protein HDU79_008001 [Rhizoclosmatium sp. JEL0117]